jgi:hypothetical protein
MSPFLALIVLFLIPGRGALLIRGPGGTVDLSKAKTTPIAGLDRRSVIASLPIFVPAFAADADTGVEVRGTRINAFNGLIFNYRGNDFNGLDANDIDEPSISYKDFVAKLKDGGISSVEFYAPDGDVAYATLKEDGKAIRIGEGYPIEQHNGYSSPAFAIRTVQNYGIPYKFVVPAMMKKRRN